MGRNASFGCRWLARWLEPDYGLGNIDAGAGDRRANTSAQRVAPRSDRDARQHPFLDEEAASIPDIRRGPFQLGGHGVSYRNGHAPVCID